MTLDLEKLPAELTLRAKEARALRASLIGDVSADLARLLRWEISCNPRPHMLERAADDLTRYAGALEFDAAMGSFWRRPQLHHLAVVYLELAAGLRQAAETLRAGETFPRGRPI